MFPAVGENKDIGMIGVHDNEVYAQTVDYEGCRILLHTVCPPMAPSEFTDVVFDGVVAHHFERQAFRGGGGSTNILFDVEESEIAGALDVCPDLLATVQNYGGMGSGDADVAAWLAADGVTCFAISSSCGLSGFVLAKGVEFRRRPSRAAIM
jgi:hypothetical protein